MTFAVLLGWVNVAAGLLCFILNLRYFLRCRSRWRSLKLVNGLVGLYVAGLYVSVLAGWSNMIDPTEFGQVYVRPAITLLLVSLTSGAILNSPRPYCGDTCKKCL